MQLRKTFFAVFALFFLVLGSMPVLAAEFIAPEDKESGRVVLGAGSEHKNVYTAGADVTVNSNVQGDLLAAGSEITTDGTVEQDVGLAAGTVSLQGPVGGDARLAGGSVAVNNSVGGDLLVAGGKLNLSEKASVGGDLVFAAGQVNIAGRVGGKILATGGNIYINSTVVGELKIWRADKVTFGPKAEILGKAIVSAKTDPVFEEGSQVPDIEFTLKVGNENRKGWIAGATAAAVALAFLGYVFVSLLIVWIAPRKTENFLSSMKSHFWMNLGIGLASVILIPILSIIAMVILIGLYAGLIAFALYLALLALAWLMGLMFMGSYTYMLVRKAKAMEVTWQAAIVGAVVYVALRFIPVIGWLVSCGIMLAALGQWMSTVKRYVIERGSRSADSE